MTSENDFKVKKSKKDKKDKVEQIDLTESCNDADVPAKVKKSKKDKKNKIGLEETVCDELLVSDDLVEHKKSKKDKKEKKEKRRLEDAAEEEVEEVVVMKEKKAKKEKLETVDEVAVETPKKEKKSKKIREEEESSHSSHFAASKSVYADTNVAVNTPKATEEWYDDSTGGAKYWKRIDEDKWKSKVEGTKFAKISHYDKGGDSWGNGAADTLSKVKGKGFVKAMQKLKRASWKGQGSIDTGVNSVQFSDWED